MRFESMAVVLSAAAFSLAGCGGKSNPQVGQPRDRYVLDFTGNDGGGVPVRAWAHYAFTVQLDAMVRPYVFADPVHEVGDGFIGSDTAYVACDSAPESLDALTSDSEAIGTGDAADVSAIRVELLPSAEDGSANDRKVCFGYRDLQGDWQWRLGVSEFHPETTTGHLVADLPAPDGRADALMILFSQLNTVGVPLLTKISYEGQ